MAGKRLARLNEQMKREISGILHARVRDPRIGSPRITAVEVTPDLWVAKVFIYSSGDAESRTRTLEGLEAAAPFIRKALGDVLRIRRIPELRFVEDRTLDHAMRIERILQEVLPPEGQDEGDVEDAAAGDGAVSDDPEADAGTDAGEGGP
jgi:ribosome-binding factor A